MRALVIIGFYKFIETSLLLEEVRGCDVGPKKRSI